MTATRITREEAAEVTAFMDGKMRRMRHEEHIVELWRLDACGWWQWKKGRVGTRTFLARLYEEGHNEIINWIISGWLRCKSTNSHSVKQLVKKGTNEELLAAMRMN